MDRLLDMIQAIPHVELLVPARHAQEILESMRRHDPAVVIAEFHIPGSKGTALLQTLRRAKPSAVLIVMTNLASPEYRKRLSESGADLCLDKTREFTHLLELMGELARCSSGKNKPATKRSLRKQFASTKLQVGLQIGLIVFIAASLLGG